MAASKKRKGEEKDGRWCCFRLEEDACLVVKVCIVLVWWWERVGLDGTVERHHEAARKGK